MFSTELRHYSLPRTVEHIMECAEAYIATMRYAGKVPERVILPSGDYNKIAEAISKSTNGQVQLSRMTFHGIPITHAGAIQ